MFWDLQVPLGTKASLFEELGLVALDSLSLRAGILSQKKFRVPETPRVIPGD